MMPVMNGWEFLARQQADAALAAIPVVVLNAAAERQLGGSLPEAVVVLQKPIDFAVVLAAVARYCAGDG